jgi:hypothetical protein
LCGFLELCLKKCVISDSVGWEYTAKYKEKNMAMNPNSLKKIRDLIIKAPALIDAVQKLIDRIRVLIDRWKNRERPLTVEALGSRLEEYDKMLEEQARIIEELAGMLGKVTLQVNVLMWVSGIACVLAIVAVLIVIFES